MEAVRECPSGAEGELGAGESPMGRECGGTPGRRAAPKRLSGAARGLLVGSPREVLARLVPHDPLGVRRVVAERLAARFLLMDGERAHLASLARIARRAGRYRGGIALEDWIEDEVDAAIDALRKEETQLARRAAAGGADLTDRNERADRSDGARGPWRAIALPLGLAPEPMRLACARFNVLSREEREAFVRVVLERRPPDALARGAGRTLTELARSARRGIEAVLAPLEAARADEAAKPDGGAPW